MKFEVGTEVYYNGLKYKIEWIYDSGMVEIRRRHTVVLVNVNEIKEIKVENTNTS